MEDQLYKTPQLHIIGKITGGLNFNSQNIYVKYNFKVGEDWNLLAGSLQGETFQSEEYDDNKFIPLEHPFDLNFAAKAIRGWPKMILEVWEVDSYGRNSIAGYSQILMPTKPGDYKLKAECWRPRGGFFDRLIGSYPELIYKDVVITNESRLGFKTETTGTIEMEISIVAKDFQFHGVKLSEFKK